MLNFRESYRLDQVSRLIPLRSENNRNRAVCVNRLEFPRSSVLKNVFRISLKRKRREAASKDLMIFFEYRGCHEYLFEQFLKSKDSTTVSNIN